MLAALAKEFTELRIHTSRDDGDSCSCFRAHTSTHFYTHTYTYLISRQPATFAFLLSLRTAPWIFTALAMEAHLYTLCTAPINCRRCVVVESSSICQVLLLSLLALLTSLPSQSGFSTRSGGGRKVGDAFTFSTSRLPPINSPSSRESHAKTFKTT